MIFVCFGMVQIQGSKVMCLKKLQSPLWCGVRYIGLVCRVLWLEVGRVGCIGRPLTANIRWRPFSSVPHVSDRLELHNNNRASWIFHPGPSESDVYSDVVQEAQWNDLLHTARLLIRLDTPLHGNNARGAKYAVYYASVATHPVFENIKMAALRAMSEEKSCSPFPCFFITWYKLQSPLWCGVRYIGLVCRVLRLGVGT